MLSFQNDYSEGCHPLILERLAETNLDQQPGYGEDAYSLSAQKRIAAACGDEKAQVVFVSGGTQVNVTAIAGMLNPWEGAVCAQTGHIHCHEAGAIEFTGHKCITLPHTDGKISASQISDLCGRFYADGAHEHMVFPGLVYLSQPTEYGTLYSLAELKAIRTVCDTYHMRLYVDGARLCYALASEKNDVSLKQLTALCDAFTIGGTKAGALCGEALVFPREGMPEHFITLTKQRGAMLAKGRLCGVQFDTLFENDLYLRCGENGIRQAMKIRHALLEKGYRLFIDSYTNQQFVILTDEQLAHLTGRIVYSVWEKPDSRHTVIRLAASWATTDDMTDELIRLL